MLSKYPGILTARRYRGVLWFKDNMRIEDSYRDRAEGFFDNQETCVLLEVMPSGEGSRAG